MTFASSPTLPYLTMHMGLLEHWSVITDNSGRPCATAMLSGHGFAPQEKLLTLAALVAPV